MLMKHPISCALSGVAIGTLEFVTCAGHVPYLSHWDNMTALHPIFSLPMNKRLAFARHEWNRLAKASEDEETTKTEDLHLRVTFLAVLHSLDSINQTAPGLPAIHIVQSQMNRLFALAYWKHYLESKRFAFPEFKINKANLNDKFENLHHYLDACFAIKEDYETKVEEAVEKEKLAAADRALKALRDSWITPTSNKALWRWVKAHMPSRYEADAQGWMSTLFLGNQSTVLDFDSDEVDLMQQIIEGECPAGTGIMKAVRDRIEWIKTVQSDHREAFTVNFEDYLPPKAQHRSVATDGSIAFSEDMKDDELVEMPAEPKQETFANKVLWIKARAMWMLQCRAISQRNSK